ncbi:hypothetical protein SAMN05443429_10624 [Cruoricaptor ignavus]|uniref:Uncharacterized protein n=1 Tax=Cruoricaptor ignavus TaxID=1118202 RepID=A0A1M6EX56_9FLAO|nr:hypothetical protein SAMN05443429_10624 [Cruoricaptor ignavus]
MDCIQFFFELLKIEKGNIFLPDFHAKNLNGMIKLQNLEKTVLNINKKMHLFLNLKIDVKKYFWIVFLMGRICQ